MMKKEIIALLFYIICVILSIIGMFLLDSIAKNIICVICLVYSFRMLEEILGF